MRRRRSRGMRSSPTQTIIPPTNLKRSFRVDLSLSATEMDGPYCIQHHRIVWRPQIQCPDDGKTMRSAKLMWGRILCANGKVEQEGVDNYVLRIKLANFYLTFVGLFVIRWGRRERQRMSLPRWDEMEPANFARHMIPKDYKKKRSSSSSGTSYNPPTFFTSLPYTCRAIPKLILGGWKWIWGVLQVESLAPNFYSGTYIY